MGWHKQFITNNSSLLKHVLKINKLIKMKKFSLVVMLFILTSAIFAQEGFVFKDIIRLDASSVKNQQSTGTCWSFSGISFLESEMLRMGKKNIPDLSPMYVTKQKQTKQYECTDM